MKKIYNYSIANFLFEFQTKNSLMYSKLIAVFGLINIIVVFPDMYDLFSRQGYINVALNDQFVNTFEPSLQWIFIPLSTLGIDANVSLLLVITLYMLALFFVLIQYQSFLFSIVAWGIHVMMVTSSYYFSYGADFFITFSLFVNIFLTIGTVLNNENKVALFQSFAIRFIQLHLCMVYFFAGFGKLMGIDWINGDAIWYVLYAFTPETLETPIVKAINYPIFFMMMGWLTVFVELLYPIFIFMNNTRKIMLFLVIGMHLGIFIFMGLYTFAAIMIVLNIVAFGHYLSSPKAVNKETLLRWWSICSKKIIPN